MGSPSGDVLRAHLAAAAVHFHISNFSAQAELRAVKANTSPISDTKDKYGKTGNRGGHRTAAPDKWLLVLARKTSFHFE